MNSEKYIQRLQYTGNLTPDIQTLKALHRHHITSIPFEALDVQFKNPISMELTDIYNKVISKNRGGYCYELNSLFHALLTEIGFDCDMISAQVYDDGKYGPAFDHMSIVVRLSELWLVDVGFGDLFMEPIRINPNVIQEDTFKKYKIVHIDKDHYVLTESLKNRSDFIIKYSFDLTARTIDEFEDQNHYKQYNPNSHFVKNTICTIATTRGRKTIRNDIFKIRDVDRVSEKRINGEAQLLALLGEEFDLEITSRS